MSTFDQNLVMLDGVALAGAVISGPAIKIDGPNQNRQLGKVPGTGINIGGLAALTGVSGTPVAAMGVITADNQNMTSAAEIIGTRTYSLAELQSASGGLFLDFSMAFGQFKEWIQLVISPTGGTFGSQQLKAWIGPRPSNNFIIADVRSLA